MFRHGHTSPVNITGQTENRSSVIRQTTHGFCEFGIVAVVRQTEVPQRALERLSLCGEQWLPRCDHGKQLLLDHTVYPFLQKFVRSVAHHELLLVVTKAASIRKEERKRTHIDDHGIAGLESLRSRCLLESAVD